MKKLTAIFLVLMLVLALLPLGALAQEGEETVYSAEQSDTLLAESVTNEPVEEASEPTEEVTEETTETTEESREESAETLDEPTEDSAEAESETASLALDGTDADTSGNCGEKLTWTLDNGKLTISGTGAMADYNSVGETPWSASRTSITSVVIGSDVTSIGNYAFSGFSSLGQVTIPEGVTSIGVCSFLNCALTSVTLPNSLTTIGQAAFSRNNALTSITIPKGVTLIPRNAFASCTALTNINVAEGNQTYSSIDGVVFSKDKQTLVLYPRGRTDLVYTIPSGVTSIGADALPDNQRLAALVIPTTVTSIETPPLSSNAYNALNIYYAGTAEQWAAVEMDETLRAHLGQVYYENTTGPSGDVIASGFCGEDVTWEFSESGTLTVSGNGAMTDYEYDPSAPWYSFRNNITSVVVESGVTHIGARAFISCGALTSATIADTVTSIGEKAFCYCYSLESLTLPSNVTSIGDAAFKQCMALTSVTIPSGVTSIGSEMFDYCTALETVTIGSGVTSIAQNAFQDCHALADVYYAGTAEDWKAVAIDDGNDRLVGATIHYKSTPVEDDDPIKPTAKTTDAKKPPRTGDESHAALWLAVALLGGCAVAGTTVVAKKKSYTR